MFVLILSLVLSLGRSGLGLLGPLGSRSGLGNGLGYVRWVIISHCKVETTRCYYSSNKIMTNNYILA